jgi:hypothetical protein
MVGVLRHVILWLFDMMGHTRFLNIEKCANILSCDGMNAILAPIFGIGSGDLVHYMALFAECSCISEFFIRATPC